MSGYRLGYTEPHKETRRVSKAIRLKCLADASGYRLEPCKETRRMSKATRPGHRADASGYPQVNAAILL